MEATNNNFFNKLFSKLKSYWKKVLTDPKEGFYFLFFILLIMMAIMVIGTVYNGGFFHFNTDDIIQYYPFMGGFIDRLKEGKLSLYDTTLFGGTSFFAGVYYLPFDIFTLLTLLLSFVMQAETAYGITNFLRPLCGALLLYYVLYRKNLKIKTCIVTSLIYFFGGMTEAYYVFPVYLGINFYAPLAMLLCDLCLDKKGKWYLLLPLYSVTVILYDFYLAYMLLAFLMIYFIVSMHERDIFSFFSKKNCFIINKEFWLRFLECFSLVILGVLMAAFMLIPSMQYVLIESSRNSTSFKEQLWFFTNYDNNLHKQVFSWRHYFTMWCNFFMPNEPHRFMLVAAGDYVKEHATFYLTCGGAVYLTYFFFLRGKRANRLKGWVLFLNALFLIPIFSKIFTANAEPYVRWFFIPYIFNMYAMALAMDENDFAIGKNKLSKLIPICVTLLGLITLTFVIVKDPDIFIHYNKADFFFYPILGVSIAILSIYLIIYIVYAILALLNIDFKVIKTITPLMIFAECVFAAVLIFCNIDNTSSWYYKNKNLMNEMKDNLIDYGYTDESGYRINIYDNSAKSTANANSLIGNVNFGRFFQSFYNTPLNTCLGKVYNEGSTSWSRAFNGGYNLLSSNIFTTKYIVCWTRQGLHFPEYYEKLGEKGEYTYYALKDMPQFIVYDDAYYSIAGPNLAFQEEAILNYAFVDKPSIINSINDKNEDATYEEIAKIKDDLIKENKTDVLDSINLYEEYLKAGISFKTPSEVKASLVGYQKTKNTQLRKSSIEEVNGSKYYCYDIESLTNLLKNDVLQIYPFDSQIREMTYNDNFIRDTNGNDHGMHYTTCYLEDSWTPSKLYVRVDDTSWGDTLSLYSYNYDIYTSFIARQNQYKNKTFKIDGNKISLTCDMPSQGKTRIIKTPYAYSNDWHANYNYKTINVDGGFLGIIVPDDVSKVNLTITYTPAGFTTGCKISGIGCIIYVGICTPILINVYRKRKEKNEKDNDNSSLL